MPQRTRPRRYRADDFTHTISERSSDFPDGKLRLICHQCEKWDILLLDTRAKDHFVCPECYRKLGMSEDWKCWKSGYPEKKRWY